MGNWYRGSVWSAWSLSSTEFLLDRVLSWYNAVGVDVLLKGVAVVADVANAVCVRREYFAAIFEGGEC